MTCVEYFEKITDNIFPVIKEEGDENLTDRDIELMKVNYLVSIAMSLAKIADEGVIHIDHVDSMQC